MDALLLALICGGLFIAAYLTYGRWLSRRVFGLREDAVTPAVALRDDKDYCPTARSVVFGHHFTSIAGTGPIVGPAIAVMWGWLPAVLWVVCGAIFIGAVHDLGSLVVSLRNKGRSVGDIAGDLLGPRVRLIFLGVLVLSLWVVLAIFGLVIAAVLRQYPSAIFPVMAQIPLAILVGVFIHKRGARLLWWSVGALAIMYASVVWGDWGPLHAFNQWCASRPTIEWVIFLLVYSYVASVIPVWLLLQPRDYINALQLVTALGLLVAGLVVAAVFGGAPLGGDGGAGATVAAASAERPRLEIVAPMVNARPEGAPPIIPMLFITIACGAISGFHCLVSSGTTSKQLKKETDARAVGYGSMLTEGFLATLVIIACAAGIGLGVAVPWKGSEFEGRDVSVLLTGASAFGEKYYTWADAGALSATVSAFVDGSANLIRSMGVPAGVAVALMGVLVASFAGTTMDTACRLQRYVIQELARTFLPKDDPHGCVSCGYDMRGLLATAPCPECGAANEWRAMGAERPHPDAAAGGAEPAVRTASVFNPFRWLATAHGATTFAVVSAAALAAIPASGQAWSWANAGAGGQILWPLFGAVNQLLGGLSFCVIGAWLIATRRPWWFMAAPAVLMLVMPAWAMSWQAFIGDANSPSWIDSGRYALAAVAGAILLLEAWLVAEVALRLTRGRDSLAADFRGESA